jgi:competence protein ComEC
MRGSLRGVVIFACILAVIVTAALSFRFLHADTDTDYLEIRFLDVGQADSALIQNKNGTVMIDTGYRDSGAYLGNVLKECGNKISCLILTHPHGDHIGGTLYVLEHCEVELVILPTQPGEDARYAAILEEIAEQNIPTRTLSPGEGFSLGHARFTFLAPLRKYTDENDNSYVIRLDYGEISALFTGDAEAESEREQLKLYGSAEGGYLDADILKVGHHGSASSTTDTYLAAVSPTYAVISCGMGNDYGHPHKEVTLRLNQAGILTLRTDLAGNVIFRTDGETIELLP